MREVVRSSAGPRAGTSVASPEAVGRLGVVVVDCLDPPALARFWGAVLGVDADLADPDWSEVHSPMTGTSLAFQRVAEPKRGKNRLHLDVEVRDLPTAIARCVGLGAGIVGPVVDDGHGSFQVMVDPELHEFCLVLPAVARARGDGPASDGTPILDVKAVLDPTVER